MDLKSLYGANSICGPDIEQDDLFQIAQYSNRGQASKQSGGVKVSLTIIFGEIVDLMDQFEFKIPLWSRFNLRPRE